MTLWHGRPGALSCRSSLPSRDATQRPSRSPLASTSISPRSCYTSGSTAQPKGVMLTHLNIVAAATSIGDYLGNTPDDVILNVLPLSFDYGLYQVFLAFKAGARLILEPSFIYTTVLLDLPGAGACDGPADCAHARRAPAETRPLA